MAWRHMVMSTLTVQDLDGGYKSSEEDWPAFHEIMIDAMNQLEAAIKPELKKLKI